LTPHEITLTFPPMKRLRIAIDQMAPVLGDLDANFARHLDAVRWAKREKADLLVFPELSLTGYLVRGMVHHVAIPIDDPRLGNLSREAGKTALVVGFIEHATDGRYFNVASYLAGGRVQATQRKLFLPNYGMFEEKRFFAQGERVEPFDAPWGRTGMLICFDILHPAAGYLMEQAGVRLLINISDSPARGINGDGLMAGERIFRTAQEAHSRLLGLITVYVNRVGTEEGLTFWGGSQIMDPFGNALLTMAEYEPQRAVCEVDLSVVDRARTTFPHLKESRPDLILQEMWRLRNGDAPVAQP